MLFLTPIITERRRGEEGIKTFCCLVFVNIIVIIVGLSKRSHDTTLHYTTHYAPPLIHSLNFEPTFSSLPFSSTIKLLLAYFFFFSLFLLLSLSARAFTSGRMMYGSQLFGACTSRANEMFGGKSYPQFLFCPLFFFLTSNVKN